ncbi:hypothetical protein PINS_up023986, partial [Pythium insidiosum]
MENDPNHDELPAAASPAAELARLPAMSPPVVDEEAECEPAVVRSASQDLAEDVTLVPSVPVPRSAPWRSFVASGDRDGDAVARLLADTPADEDAARTRLEEMRQLAYQRLSELLA